MVKFVFWLSLILTILWAILLINVNVNKEPFWILDKDILNSGLSIFSILVTIVIGYLCWRYTYKNDNKNNGMSIGNNAKNVIQVNGNLKIKK